MKQFSLKAVTTAAAAVAAFPVLPLYPLPPTSNMWEFVFNIFSCFGACLFQKAQIASARNEIRTREKRPGAQRKGITADSGADFSQLSSAPNARENPPQSPCSTNAMEKPTHPGLRANLLIAIFCWWQKGGEVGCSGAEGAGNVC